MDFKYYGDYQVDSTLKDDTERDRDPAGLEEIVAHLRCYAIAASYQIPAMSNAALENFKGLLMVSHPADVADTVELLAGISTSNAVKYALRDVAFERLEDLANSDAFMRKLGNSTVPTVAGIVVNMLHKAVERHEATIDRNQELERNLRRREETIEVGGLTTPIVDLELSVLCKRCGHLHTVDNVL